MNELLFIAQAIAIFSIVVLAKKFFGKKGLITWVGLATVLANIQVVKSIDLFGLSATLGNALFASTFLATDILSEHYGKKHAKTAVKVGVFSVLAFLVVSQFTLLFQPNEIDFVDSSMKTLFELAPRTMIASLIMYIIANTSDVFLFDKLKKVTKGKHLWLRNNICTIVCNCLENFGFSILAFAGIFGFGDIMQIALTTCVLEIVLAVIDTPFAYLAKYMKCKNED